MKLKYYESPFEKIRLALARHRSLRCYLTSFASKPVYESRRRICASIILEQTPTEKQARVLSEKARVILSRWGFHGFNAFASEGYLHFYYDLDEVARQVKRLSLRARLKTASSQEKALLAGLRGTREQMRVFFPSAKGFEEIARRRYR